MKQQSPPDLSLFSSRLRHLHNIISLVPDDMFDLEKFSYSSACGTVGCAAGWATQDPAFQAMGFEAVSEGDQNWIPVYLDLSPGFESIETFFGIEGTESDLFILSPYVKSDEDDPYFCPSRGKFKQEFLDRLERQIEKSKVRESV